MDIFGGLRPLLILAGFLDQPFYISDNNMGKTCFSLLRKTLLSMKFVIVLLHCLFIFARFFEIFACFTNGFDFEQISDVLFEVGSLTYSHGKFFLKAFLNIFFVAGTSFSSKWPLLWSKLREVEIKFYLDKSCYKKTRVQCYIGLLLLFAVISIFCLFQF